MERADQFIVSVNPIDPEHHCEYFIHLFSRLVKLKNLKSLYWACDSVETWSFMRWANMYMPGTGKHVLLLAHKDEVIGFALLEDIIPKQRCMLGLWIEPKWRGPNTPLVGKQILTYVHAKLGIKYAYTMSPHNSAIQLASRIGMISLGDLPGFCIINEKERGVEIFYSETSLLRNILRNDLIEMGYLAKSAEQLVADIFEE